MSEKDGESLQKLLVEFENISEKNRKINDNNFLREQMQSIDFHKYQNDLKVYPELQDVSQKLNGNMFKSDEAEMGSNEKVELGENANGLQKCLVHGWAQIGIF